MSTSTEWYNKHPDKKYEHNKKYREKHKDRIKAKAALNYAENKESISKKHKEYYLENREAIYRKMREWVAENRDKDREYKRKWAENNKDYIRKRQKQEYSSIKAREKYLKNRDKELARANERYRNMTDDERAEHNRKRRERHAKNPGVRNEMERIRGHQKRAHGSLSKDVWAEVCKRYANTCIYCGSKDKITIEHLLPVSKGGTNEANNLAPACLSCNSGKRNKTEDEYREWRTAKGLFTPPRPEIEYW